MTSPEEQQLLRTKDFTHDRTDFRVGKLQGAIDELNAIATEIRNVASNLHWKGDAGEAAVNTFAKLASAINEHADGINAVNGADRATGEPLLQAKADCADFDLWNFVPTGSNLLAGLAQSAGQTPEEYRAERARSDKRKLDIAMHTMAGRIRSGVTWDLDNPQPAPADPGPQPGGDGGDGSGGSGSGGSGGTGSGGSGGSGGAGAGAGAGGGGAGGGGDRPDQVVADPGAHGATVTDQGAHLAPGGHDSFHGGGTPVGGAQHGQWHDGSGHHVQWQDANGQWHEVAATQLQWQDGQGHWHDADGQWQDAGGAWHAAGGASGGDTPAGLHHGGSGHGDPGNGASGNGASGNSDHGNGGHGNGGHGAGGHGNGAHSNGGQDDGQQQLRWRDDDGRWHVVDAGQLQWQDTAGAWHDGDGAGPGGGWQSDDTAGRPVPATGPAGGPVAPPGTAVWSDHLVDRAFSDGAGPTDAVRDVTAPAPVSDVRIDHDTTAGGGTTSPPPATAGAVRADFMTELSRRLGGSPDAVRAVDASTSASD